MASDFHGGEIKEKIEYDFSVNTNPLGMPDYVKQAILENTDMFCTYPDRLCKELRECIAKYEHIEDSQILCGNGASELIMSICASVSVEHEINALVSAPTFSGYERAIKAYGGNVSYYRNVDELINKISNGEYNLLFICNPNNPTGEVIDGLYIQKIIDIAGEKNILVVIDECFIDFTHEESLVRHINEYGNLIVIKAFTKFYSMAGIRLGYLCSQNVICEKIKKFLAEWNVSNIAQLAGISAYSDIDKVNRWKNKTLKLIDEERAYLISKLSEMGFEVSDSKANYIMLKSRKYDLWNELRSHGILVRDCQNFNGLDNSYIRICISNHKNNEILINALNKLV